MNRLQTGIERSVRAFAAVAAFAIVAMMLLTCADVFLRYLLNTPIEGSLDLTQMLMVVIVFFGLAYCGWTGGHVAVDLLRDLVPRAVVVPLARLVNLVGAVVMLAMAWQSVLMALTFMKTGETPMTVLIPKYPFVLVVTFGAFTYAGVLLFKTVLPDEGNPHRGPRE